MSTFAAVMTGKGTGAISTIQLFGERPRAIIKKIFKPAGSKPAILKPGKIYLGTINNGSEIIDQVTIGCEGPHSFAINCHGNPLIVSEIMKLLAQHGATLIAAEQLLTKILTAGKFTNTIALEAKLAQPTARTIEGAKIIANQINAGLSKTAQRWLQNINAVSLNKIKKGAERILQTSQTAKLIIHGCTMVLAGPPNTGKSTLLNALAGRQKAIVTDIKGTTRDWVSARCKISPLAAEVIDTAGMDEPCPSEGLGEKLTITPKNTIGKKSQQKTAEILQEADLVLLVLDNSKTADQLEDKLLEKIAGRLVLSKACLEHSRRAEGKTLTVLNKSDLPAKFDTVKLPQMLANTIRISAEFGAGIENLIEKIRQITGVADFDLQQPVCFTSRQENLVKQLCKTKSKDQAASIITELLNGQLRV